MNNISDIISLSKIIPVVTIHNADDAICVADALYEGGIKIIEITLRTNAALQAIRNLESHPIVAGAGTVTNIEQLKMSVDASAQFFVSPGFTSQLSEAAQGLAYLPGVTTTSEIMRALGHGHEYLKFFPAEASGGINVIQNFGAIFPGIKFCPTGGITEDRARHYLKLSNVVAVGGSWLARREDIANKHWTKIKGKAKVSLL